MGDGVIDRRTMLAAGAVAAASGLAPALGAAILPRPNILFIMADDLGYADVSCYGRREYATPAIDALARDGVRLTQGYANSAVCSATRTALITGRYQYRLRIGLEEPIPGGTDVSLPAAHPTLPSLFKRLGYRTALIGKWHLGTLPKLGPTAFGYDHFLRFKNGGLDYFSHRYNLTRPDAVGDGLFEDTQPIERHGYLTDLLGEEAIRWIGHDRQPFLLSLHFNAPHWPWEGPDDEAVSRTLKTLAQPDGGDLPTYARMVTAMDRAIGRVLAALDANGMARDTIVVFTSDNGGERYSDVWPFTGIKGELLEGGLRVPLIVRWPGRIRAGGTSLQVMTSMDFLPTLLSAAGGAPDPAFPADGINLLPVLTGAAPVRPRTLYWRYKAFEQQAVRDGDWKYLRIGGREHLFDVARDPRERAERKAAEPAIFARLKAQYAAWDATMLPYPAGSYSYDTEAIAADHYPRPATATAP